MSDKHITGQEDTGVYRNKISTVDESGKRVWVYPKKPSGKFHQYRTLVSFFLLAVLFAGPFITVNGQPILLLNIIERKFFIFGTVFWPQDFHLFGLAIITLVVFIVLFTVIFGRIFCGWACPQTIFMEMVFRKIEYWIEGDASQQRKLNKAPMSPEKFLKKSVKHTIFYAISFLIGNTFLAYIIGKDEVFRIISEPPSEHLTGLFAMIVFSFLFYGVFSWFREQVCTLVCPYGRLQGVLLDQNSIVVHYDFKRGEPRGKGKRIESSNLGDCIDCNQCVEVCPTGIDIRDGTQLECVNCTACIDACDAIMDKVKKPRGLIRYSSYNAILDGVKKIATPRALGYTGILFSLLVFVTVLLANRNPIETTILRTPGVMYQELENGNVSNLYNIRVVNKTFEIQDIKVVLSRPANGTVKMISELIVEKEGLGESIFFVEIPHKNLYVANFPLELEIYSGEKLIETVTTSFLGPGK